MGCVVVCRVPRGALLPQRGAGGDGRYIRPRLSVLLLEDASLLRALNTTLQSGDETFSPLYPHIVRMRLPETLSIPPCESTQV